MQAVILLGQDMPIAFRTENFGQPFSSEILSCQRLGFDVAMRFSLLLSLLFMAFSINLGAKIGFI